MGVFDDLRCKYPLPIPEAQDFVFQTKDTDAQYCDDYELREDGTLWRECYDSEIIIDPSSPLGMRQDRRNIRWEQEVVTGEVCFYHLVKDESRHLWYEFQAWFRDGVLKEIVGSKTDRHCPENNIRI